MKTKKTNSVLLLLILSLSIQRTTQKKTKIVLEIFRHGARDIVNKFPLESKVSSSRESIGDLTMTGMRQHYNLGSLFQLKYADFLKREIDNNPSSVQTFSSDRHRTIASLNAHLQGIFASRNINSPKTSKAKTSWLPPSVSKSNYKKNLSKLNTDKSKAIPVNFFFPADIQGEKSNFLFHSQYICPTVFPIQNLQNREIPPNMLKILEPSLQVLKKSGYDIGKLYPNESAKLNSILETTDYILAQYWSVPSEKIDYNLLIHSEVLQNLMIIILLDFDKVRKLMVYHIFKKVSENLERYQKNKDYKKLMIFSGHDDNVISILLTLYNKDNVDILLVNYQQFLANATVNSKDEYLAMKQKLSENKCFPTIPFASNLIFEIFKGTDHQLFIKQA